MYKIPQPINERISWAVSFSWDICLLKIKDREISVNKEASLQLHFANILKNVLDLIKFNKAERYDVELESNCLVNRKNLIADVIVKYSFESFKYVHVIELKFYKTYTAHGTKRGAQDIFMCEVYKDLFHCETYINSNFSNACTCLILTDFKNFIYPKSKQSKSWTYDISDQHETKIQLYDVAIGGKENNFTLTKAHNFKWENVGDYYACLIKIE